MREITLNKGKTAKVDDDDYWWLMQYAWYAVHDRPTCWYAYTRVNRKIVSMHRYLLRSEFVRNPELETDHIDGDGLNNQRSNLRLVTRSENMHNVVSNTNSTSEYVGVFWNREKKKWQAFIKHEGKTCMIGRYDDGYDAALARDLVALDLWGEYAKLNVLQTHLSDLTGVVGSGRV